MYLSKLRRTRYLKNLKRHEKRVVTALKRWEYESESEYLIHRPPELTITHTVHTRLRAEIRDSESRHKAQASL